MKKNLVRLLFLAILFMCVYTQTHIYEKYVFHYVKVAGTYQGTPVKINGFLCN